MEMTLFPLKLDLLSFWGLWLLFAFLTNLCEWLKVVRIIRSTGRSLRSTFRLSHERLRPIMPSVDSQGLICRRPSLAALDPHLLWMGHRLLCHGGGLAWGRCMLLNDEHRSFGRLYDCR